MTEAHLKPAPTQLPLRVLGPALAVLGALTLLAAASIYILGGVRAYVSGESLWSKARSSAVQHLHVFANSRDPMDYAHFESALAVPLGDRMAREALMQPTPDCQRARQGFIAGDNHPDDVDSMIQLFLWLGNTWLFRDALGAWMQGDVLIAQLRVQARALYPLVMDQAPTQVVTERLQHVVRLDEQLAEQERRFTKSLGESARQAEWGLMASLVGAFVLMASAMWWWIRQVLAHTQRHQHALHESQRRWELAAQNADLGLYQFDLVDDVVQLDARGAAMHGLGAEATTVSRLALHARMVPPDGDEVTKLVEAASRTGDTFHLRYRLRVAEGDIRHVVSIGRIDLSAGLAARRGVGVVRDISQEVTQAEHTSERDAARKVAQSQRAFLSRLSHELRTPLNAVLGFAQLLNLDHAHPMSAAQRQQVAWILSAGQQLLRLVEDVMDLSKVEAGELTLHLAPTDANAVIANTLGLVEAERQRAGVSIVHSQDGQAQIALVDPQRLMQVLINLLSNACKYNRPGGRVTVSARTVTQGGTPWVAIEVSDSGMGIAPEHLGDLFQAFKRLPPAQQSNPEGTGLGLYIVSQLVSRMQGSVSVQSTPGVGTHFTVKLPFGNTNASAGAPAEASMPQADALRA